ncbi:MAG: polyketide synthase dehydratase domain-containing protein [Smithellaceae bacterium]|nr:polyketide synthase dehydratase domain-containing protein [Smithellaceae bacterium]
MADFSRQTINRHIPVMLGITPYLRDHRVEGKAVFPAVEALVVLAKSVKSHYPRAVLYDQSSALFPKALSIEEAGESLEAQIEMDESADGIIASLQTSMKIKNSSISRTLDHAKVTFAKREIVSSTALSFRTARKMESLCIQVPAASIYRELVPFGASYQNITGDLTISKEGALADIAGGSGEADDDILGSPFVLDAAMHAACVWGQRFADRVAFPVGFDRRMIYKTTKKNRDYCARINPVITGQEELTFV